MSFWENLNAVKAFWSREIGRFIRLWQQTLLPPIITTSLYFLIFGNIIGSRVGEMRDVPFITFILPGLVVMPVILGAYTNASFSLFSMKFQRSIEEIIVSPMNNAYVLAGFIVPSVVRGLIVGLLVALVSLFFVEWRPYSVLGMLGVLVLSACFFSCVGFINALYANHFDDVNIIPNFVLTPLIYLGGVFYSIQLLPEPWQTLSQFNPVFYLVNLQRYAMIGVSDAPIGMTLVAILVLTALALAACLVLLKRGTGIRE